jgi:hypothetical protein
MVLHFSAVRKVEKLARRHSQAASDTLKCHSALFGTVHRRAGDRG